MLSTTDIIKKVKELEIISKRITTHLFTGEYHSAFKGKGMRFREVREYYHGDDVRFIDWNVSARFSHPFTKVFEEERELTVILLVDVSASALFGTLHGSKRDLCPVTSHLRRTGSGNCRGGIIDIDGRRHSLAAKGDRCRI